MQGVGDTGDVPVELLRRNGNPLNRPPMHHDARMVAPDDGEEDIVESLQAHSRPRSPEAIEDGLSDLPL